MASPIHSFLFSPPPSPPLRTGATEEDPISTLSPLRSVLPLAVRKSFDAAINPRSPKLGQQNTFMLPPTAPPSRSVSPAGRAARYGLKNIDVEAANVPTTFRRTRLSPILSPRRLKGTTIPKPIVRVIVCASLVFAGVLLLQNLADAFYPSAAHMSNMSHYTPPQVAAAQHAKPLVAAPPRTERPHSHPLPQSHELLALQSFVSESRYHILKSDVDASKPIDASDLIGSAARRFGQPGSVREQAWLAEVANENAHNIVLWYASDAVPYYATEGIMARHGHGDRPTMISISDRADAGIMHDLFARFGFDLTVAPVLVIGGEAIHATPEAMTKLRDSGALSTKLTNIGWHV